MRRIKVLECTYNKVILPKHNFFMPVQVGFYFTNNKYYFAFDKAHDNISIKNNFNSELTFHYWAWRTLKEMYIICLNYSRVYFDNNYFAWTPDRNYISVEQFLSEPYQLDIFERIFYNYDIILSNRETIHIIWQYVVCHIVNGWKIIKKIMKKHHPNSFLILRRLLNIVISHPIIKNSLQK